MIASSGRAGSTLLCYAIDEQTKAYKLLKTHILPPNAAFTGKIIFIFSNPDKTAESILHLSIRNSSFGRSHLLHMGSSDLSWLKKIGRTSNQTTQDNVLSYDAYGIYEQLNQWLQASTEQTSLEEAQILAIKYENLWEIDTQQAIMDFLHLHHFRLPAKQMRGYSGKALNKKERLFRTIYNLGTDKDPRYAAYAKASELWQQAPAFQFLKLTTTN
ncbi:MAG: hypothetical protein HY860_03370 [Chlamydiales bacterium]|nr:hypothetical protein [Chlamydiales bacterium]